MIDLALHCTFRPALPICSRSLVSALSTEIDGLRIAFGNALLDGGTIRARPMIRISGPTSRTICGADMIGLDDTLVFHCVADIRLRAMHDVEVLRAADMVGVV